MNMLYDHLHPQAWYNYMCKTSPVWFDPDKQIWNVFRFQDVQAILQNPQTFSSRRYIGRGLQASLLASDPPRHRRLRTLVGQHFTPQAIARLEDRILAITHSLLDAVIPTGQMDVVDDLAHPLPTIVIAELLGIPARDRKQFRQWSDALVAMDMAPAQEQQAQSEMEAYFLQVIEQRRRELGDDLISTLLRSHIDGESLSQQELLSFCILLLVAGNETTTTLIGNALVCLDEYPDALQALRVEPALLPNAVEEVLRYYAPVKMVARVATADTMLGNHEIKAGQYLLLWIAAANCDERAFPQPAVFDIRRTPNKHLAFGYGIHFCLGAPLTRLETRIALTVLLKRLPQMERIREVPLEPLENSVNQGVKHFPVRFSPGPGVYKESPGH